ncbi:MAG TPA: homocysteine S-methyltransferase family protein [Alphaproteobacteria bacterium]|nr:homocysteine S-methyltransferase family protein [Alphaproteobacteria bacterium]
MRATSKTTGRPAKGAGLLQRLAKGPVICAEGYLFELERRGYLQAGAYVPEVVLEHPELVEQLHREFVHAGSDVVEAFTYYGHRAKLRLIGREQDLEPMNRQALAIAKKVARSTGTLLAGNICNTTTYVPDDKATHKAARKMFDEQIGWARDAGADFVVGETYSHGGEALIGLAAIKAAKLPAVMTLAIHNKGVTREGWDPVEACKRLEDGGAEVVGLNCSRGPRTMLPLLKRIRKAVKCHVAALPVPYRTTTKNPTFQTLHDSACPGDHAFPIALDPFTCNRFEIAEFGKAAYALGVRYLGVCCGAGPHHVRALAEALGRHPPASRYSADMSKHYIFGKTKGLREQNLKYARVLRG